MTAVPDAMPDRLAPQLATLVGAPPSGSGWVYEIKFDGYRILARSEGRSTRLYTRNGNDWTAKMESLCARHRSIDRRIEHPILGRPVCSSPQVTCGDRDRPMSGP
jgi:ATP-dependent DNA ligase